MKTLEALPATPTPKTIASNTAPNRLLYDRISAARVLSISPRSLDYLTADRKLTVRRIGSRVLIPATELSRIATGVASSVVLECLLYGRIEAARLLSISTRSVDHLIARGVVKAQRVGGRVLVPATELRRMAREDHPFPVSVSRYC